MAGMSRQAIDWPPAGVAASADLPLVCWFEDCRKDSVPLVGGKCSSLGELINAGVRVPPGFALTTEGYRRFMAEAGHRRAKSQSLLGGLDAQDMDALETASASIRAVIEAQPFSDGDRGPGRRVLPQAGGALRACRRCRWRCAPAPRPRTWPARASPASRTPTCGSAASTTCCTTCAAASPACTPAAPSPTAPTGLRRRRRWRSASACRRWPTPTRPA